MKVHFFKYLTTAVLLASVQSYALEIGAGANSDQSKINLAELRAQNDLAALQAILDKILVCNTMGKFYKPTDPKANAKGCVGPDMKEIRMEWEQYTWPWPSSVPPVAGAMGNTAASRDRYCIEKGYASVFNHVNSSYNSPRDNYVVLWEGGRWVVKGARDYNNIVAQLTCVRFVWEPIPE